MEEEQINELIKEINDNVDEQPIPESQYETLEESQKSYDTEIYQDFDNSVDEWETVTLE